MAVTAWQERQVIPALAVGSVSGSKAGSSKRLEKSGTGSWQTAQSRAASRPPSRASTTARVSSTLAR